MTSVGVETDGFGVGQVGEVPHAGLRVGYDEVDSVLVDGSSVGSRVVSSVGEGVGSSVGIGLGFSVGAIVGPGEGSFVGFNVGSLVGEGVGSSVGIRLGISVGVLLVQKNVPLWASMLDPRLAKELAHPWG